MSWIQFLHKQARLNPQKEALIDQKTRRRLTYRNLLDESLTWAQQLVLRGVERGDRVAYTNTNSLEHITLFFACAHIGAIFVPINWRLGDQEKEEILESIDAKCVFCGDITLENSKTDFSLEKLPEVTMEDPLLMLFTSGSTGKPKGVLFHGEMLLANQKNTVEAWGLKSIDKTIVETPFFHTGGYNVLLLPLLFVGGTTIIAEKFSPDNFYQTLEEEKLSVYFGVPTMFQNLIENENFHRAEFGSMRFLISGGAPCTPELIKSYQQKGLMFKQGFGLTEVGPNCFMLSEEHAISKLGSIGKPMPHSEVMLIDDEKEVGVGKVGELVIKGPHVCLGYYQNENRFQSCLYKGHFKTGDLAKKDSDGFYYIVGRKKDMYISGGENVYPAEVERKIDSHSDITESIVVSVPDEKWDEVGYAFYRSEKEIQLNELREFLNPLLSRYKHPQYLERLEHFPLLDNGKVDKTKLKELATQSF